MNQKTGLEGAELAQALAKDAAEELAKDHLRIHEPMSEEARREWQLILMNRKMEAERLRREEVKAK